VTFDAIGQSYYGDWHGSFAGFQTTLDDAASRHGTPVLVAETAHPSRPATEGSLTNIIDTTGELVAGYAASSAGQSARLRDVRNIVEAVPNGRGIGVFHWGPPGRRAQAPAGTRRTAPPPTAGRTGAVRL
jgi:arabinogalactan endo-1,4-beta-galactosidase